MRIIGFCFRLLGGLILAALVALLFGWLVQHLWNWLMPTLFHLPTLTFWQAAGLVLLSRLLFGHVGGGRPSKDWKRRHRKWHAEMARWKSSKPSAFAPGGDFANWEHFDEWWANGGETRFEASVGESNRCLGWWKWWKKDGRREYEAWLEERRTAG